MITFNKKVKNGIRFKTRINRLWYRIRKYIIDINAILLRQKFIRFRTCNYEINDVSQFNILAIVTSTYRGRFYVITSVSIFVL